MQEAERKGEKELAEAAEVADVLSSEVERLEAALKEANAAAESKVRQALSSLLLTSAPHMSQLPARPIICEPSSKLIRSSVADSQGICCGEPDMFLPSQFCRARTLTQSGAPCSSSWPRRSRTRTSSGGRPRRYRAGWPSWRRQPRRRAPVRRQPARSWTRSGERCDPDGLKMPLSQSLMNKQIGAALIRLASRLARGWTK